jgi:hypothetical protein
MALFDLSIRSRDSAWEEVMSCSDGLTQWGFTARGLPVRKGGVVIGLNDAERDS